VVVKDNLVRLTGDTCRRNVEGVIGVNGAINDGMDDKTGTTGAPGAGIAVLGTRIRIDVPILAHGERGRTIGDSNIKRDTFVGNQILDVITCVIQVVVATVRGVFRNTVSPVIRVAKQIYCLTVETQAVYDILQVDILDAEGGALKRRAVEINRHLIKADTGGQTIQIDSYWGNSGGITRSIRPYGNIPRREGRKKFRIESDKHPRKRALTLEQVRVLKDIELPEWQREYRDMFMLMVYLIGVNAVDLFTARPSQLRSGRLEYDRRKTGTPYSIKVEPEALAIIKRYRGKSFLLSPCDRYKDYRNYLHHMNDALKKIGIHYENRQRLSGEPLFPELSTYWARHTWSSLAANLGVAKDINGKAMGHAWASDTVTDIYISIDPMLIDNANREVIDAICLSNE